MLKRIFPVISVIAIVCCLFVTSVSAASTTYPYGDKYERFSVLQFDTIGSGYAGLYEWPFNTGVAGGSSDFAFENDEGTPMFYGDLDMSVSSMRMNGAFVMPSDSSFQLKSEFMLLGRGNSYTFEIVGYDQCPISYVYVSFTVWNFNEKDFGPSVGIQYAAEPHTVSGTLYPGGLGFVDLYDGILSLIPSDISGNLAFITNLSVDVNFQSISVVTPKFMVSCDTTLNDPSAYFSTWIYQQNLECGDTIVNSSSSFNLGTWLADSVSGFLKAEIFPGFSIDKIFYIVLVVGVLLWFFKVIS